MKYFFILSVFTFLVSCSEHPRSESLFTFPPEWDQHEAIWLGWQDRTERNVSNEFLLDVAKVLTQHVKVNIVVQNDSVEAYVLQQAKNMSIPGDSITFYQHFDTFFGCVILVLFF